MILSPFISVLFVLICAFLIENIVIKVILVLVIFLLNAFSIYKAVSFPLIGYRIRNNKYRRTKLGEEKTQIVAGIEKVFQKENIFDMIKKFYRTKKDCFYNHSDC